MTSAEPRWQPLLCGHDAERARMVAMSITGELRGLPSDVLRLHAHDLALLEAYESGPTMRLEQLLDVACDRIANDSTSPCLFGGFVGVAWAFAHVARVFDESQGDTLDEIDDALHALLAEPEQVLEYDLTAGLVGLGVYAVERWPKPRAVDCLAAVIRELDRRAIRTRSGLAWWTSGELLGPEMRDESPDGQYNVGVAHGVPGVIALLGQAYVLGVEADRARALLDGSITWLLAQRQPDSAESAFPYCIHPRSRPERSRCAWCYGDPGVAAVLLCAARAAGEPAWELEALTIARAAAARDPALTGVRDAGLCHGSAGLAHIYNRFFQMTGDPELRAAAGTWLLRTLDLCVVGTGIGGYRSLRELDDQEVYVDDPSVLTGAVGIALVLHAATGANPAWDRLLLLSPVDRG